MLVIVQLKQKKKKIEEALPENKYNCKNDHKNNKAEGEGCVLRNHGI